MPDGADRAVIALGEARRRVFGACAVLEAVEVPLARAVGCVAASTVLADAPIPGFANSAMDGYAVRAADTVPGMVDLRVVGCTRAGEAPIAMGTGQAVRIMTGAPMPVGADAVCMQESTSPGTADGTVRIPGPVEPGAYVRHPGDDVTVGQVLLEAGTALGPAHAGLLAGQGRQGAWVHRRPVVGVLSTGDELLDPPAPLEPGRIRDGNRPALLAALAQSRFVPVDLGSVPDEETAIGDALEAGAARCDAVVVSGGVSVGDADLVTAVLADRCAGTSHWMQVAIRPAKPFAFGLLGGRVPVFGVPGNPVSALVSFELLVRPALRRMAGHTLLDRPAARAVADESLTRIADGKVHYVRVRAEFADDGRLHARPIGAQQSHLLHALAMANALAVVPDGSGLEAGDTVDVLLLDPEGLAGTGQLVPWDGAP
jgi:molybdenum cofactor synthesis domain-containing protein